MADRLVILLPKTMMLSQMDKACFTVLATLQTGRGHSDLGPGSTPSPRDWGRALGPHFPLAFSKDAFCYANTAGNKQPTRWLASVLHFFFRLKHLTSAFSPKSEKSLRKKTTLAG